MIRIKLLDKTEIDTYRCENTTNKDHDNFHYSFSPIEIIIVIIVPTTAHKTPKSKTSLSSCA